MVMVERCVDVDEEIIAKDKEMLLSLVGQKMEPFIFGESPDGRIQLCKYVLSSRIIVSLFLSFFFRLAFSHLPQQFGNYALQQGAIHYLKAEESSLIVCCARAVFYFPMELFHLEVAPTEAVILAHKLGFPAPIGGSFVCARYWSKHWWTIDDRGCLVVRRDGVLCQKCGGAVAESTCVPCGRVNSGGESIFSGVNECGNLQAIEFIGAFPLLGDVRGCIRFCEMKALDRNPPRESVCQSQVLSIVCISNYSFLSIHATGQIASWIYHTGM